MHLSEDFPRLLWMVTSVHTCRREAEGRKLAMAFLVEENWPFCFYLPGFCEGLTSYKRSPCSLLTMQAPSSMLGGTQTLSLVRISGLYCLFYLPFAFCKSINLFFSYYYSVHSGKQTWQIRNFNAETSELWCLKLQNIPGSILRLHDSNVCIKKKASGKNEEPRAGTVSGYPGACSPPLQLWSMDSSTSASGGMKAEQSPWLDLSIISSEYRST